MSNSMHRIYALLFELSVLGSCYLLARRISDSERIGPTLYMTVFLCCVVVALIAFCFTALGINSPASYLVSAALLTVCAISFSCQNDGSEIQFSPSVKVRTLQTQRQVVIWDQYLVPISRWLDAVFRGQVGKSVIGVWYRAA